MSKNNPAKDTQQLHETRQVWDAAAASFDNQPDHGLHDPIIRAAWIRLLKPTISTRNSTVLDIGCGTGSISLVLAELGNEVTGIDISPNMISLAEAKARDFQHQIKFYVMDAAFPELPSAQFDMIICRHLLWALPGLDQVLARWIRLLKPGGRLLLIEGFWFTGAGLRAKQIIDVLPASICKFSIENLSDQADLWGTKVDDERYAIIADLCP